MVRLVCSDLDRVYGFFDRYGYSRWLLAYARSDSNDYPHIDYLDCQTRIAINFHPHAIPRVGFPDRNAQRNVRNRRASALPNHTIPGDRYASSQFNAGSLADR